MIKIYLTAIALAVSTFVLGQKFKRFFGSLEYKITVEDTSFASLYPDSRMIIYTNDTIVRMENQTSSLGSQVTIRHTEKQKAYQLLNTEFGKFAIQANLSNNSDSVKNSSKYIFHKTCKGEKRLGKKAIMYEVEHEAYKDKKNFLFFKKYSNKYINTFNEVPYLPVVYYVITQDVILKYELVSISEYIPHRDLFGIPTDFEKVTFDEFLDKYLEFKGQKKSQE